MKGQSTKNNASGTQIVGPRPAPAKRKQPAAWRTAPQKPEGFARNRLPFLQARLRVSQPNDPHEREADEVAHQVVNTPDSAVGDTTETASADTAHTSLDRAPAPANTAAPTITEFAGHTASRAAQTIAAGEHTAPEMLARESVDREAEQRESEEEREAPAADLSRKATGSDADPNSGEGEGNGSPGDAAAGSSGDAAAGSSGDAGDSSGSSGGDGTIAAAGGGGNTVDPETESRIRALRGRGRALSTTEKRFFESRFGRDFSRVRLHTDGQSQDLAKRVQAKAFAIGPNVVFGQGYYQPGTHAGRELMAHELTHVAQQGHAPIAGAKGGTGAIARTGTIKPKPATGVSRANESVQRVPDNEEEGTLLKKVSKYADRFAGNIPGFRLVTLIIGFNPITRKRVARTATNLVRAAAALIPGGDLIFSRIQRSKVLQRAFRWLSANFRKLNITLPFIKSLLKRALGRLGKLSGLGLLKDAFVGAITGSNPFPKILSIFKDVFGPTLRKLKNFLVNAAKKLREFSFRGFIRLVGGREGPVFRFIRPVYSLLGRIFKDPVTFGRNLIGAVRLGFGRFRRNFTKHFKAALFGWMFGTFSRAGINVPKSFEPAAIFGFVTELFAITVPDIRAKVVKRLGPKGNTIMTAVEKSIQVMQILVSEGPMGLYKQIKNDMGNLKATILQAVLKWVAQTIVVKAVVKIASLLNPAGAIVQAILAIYNTVMFFIERYQQIKALVQGVMGSLRDIVMGRIGPASRKVERTMGRALTLVISFLARLTGLGNIVKPVKEVIKRIKKRIDKAIDKVIRQIVVRARLLWRKTKRGAKKVAGKILDWWKYRKGFKLKNGEAHEVFVTGRPPNAKIKVASSDPREIPRFLTDSRRELEERSTPEETAPPRSHQVALRSLTGAQKIFQRLARVTTARPKTKVTTQSPDAGRANIRMLDRLKQHVFNIMNHLTGTTNGEYIRIPTVQVPAFKVSMPHRQQIYSSNEIWRHKSYQRGATGQRGIWEDYHEGSPYMRNARQRLERKILAAGDTVDANTYRFRTNSVPSEPKSLDNLLMDYRIPKWGRSGARKRYEVDHIAELQLVGWHASSNPVTWANAPGNMELLDKSPNASSGKRIDNHLLALANTEVRKNPSLASDGKDLMSKYNLRFSSVNGSQPPSISRDDFWTRQEIEAGEHIDTLEYLPRRRR